MLCTGRIPDDRLAPQLFNIDGNDVPHEVSFAHVYLSTSEIRKQTFTVTNDDPRKNVPKLLLAKTCPIQAQPAAISPNNRSEM